MNTVDIEQSPCSLYYVPIRPISAKNKYFMLCEYSDNIFKEKCWKRLLKMTQTSNVILYSTERTSFSFPIYK